jgi:hypothetical protein
MSGREGLARLGLLREMVFVFRRVRADSVPREPAGRLLPEEERWRPRTWARFRRVVLVHLRDEGAHSLDELVADPPGVLGLPLSSQELTAVLESCRRRGLVARLDPGAGSGSLGPDDEWMITDEGRRLTRHSAAWALDHAGRLLNLVVALIPLAAIVGLSKLLDTGEVDVIPALLLVAVALVAGMAIAIWLRPRLNGSRARRAVALDWIRWQRERPTLQEKALEGFPGRWAIGALVAFGAGLLVLGFFPGLDWLAFVPFYLSGLPIYAWLTRWDEIESDRRDWERSEAAAAAAEELQARAAGRRHAPSNVV